MSVFKSHRYGVRTEWREGHLVRLEAPGKPSLHVALPSDFKDGVPGVWSPEELLISSLATCFELTMLAVAEYREVPLHSLRVDATGYVEHKDHLYRLVLLELDVHVETDAGCEAEVERIAAVAHEGCLVGKALDIPVRLDVETRAPVAADAVAAGGDGR
jgi:organic hydroperoxide reductase OsmC/OhrA